MTLNSNAPWHRKSFERLLEDGLPSLLAERLPLLGYHAETTDRFACRLKIVLASTTNGDIELVFSDVPQPDEDGLFCIEGESFFVLPTASHEDLETADIRCVGEQLLDYIQERLAQAPDDLPWDEAMARAWLPLDTWIGECLSAIARRLEGTNWLSHTHLRRLLVLNRRAVIARSQFGRVCPFETPEGPNIGRVLSIAVGAEIRDHRLVILDNNPEAGLGLTTSMIPFLEHNDPNRTLMGANMMRQALVPPDPEPALVQTGNEPDAPDFWYGRNLLTAFVSWGADTFDDGIVISESAAQRLNTPYPAEPGDKLSNRYGTKGVVSRVIPDDQMPHLSDGTPVELVFNFVGLHLRWNFGQIREALMSRIALAEGAPAVVPPYHAPDENELRERLIKAGLPESGMEMLTLGQDGPQLERPSTVGWVYWSRLGHLARDKVRASTGKREGQRQGELECNALRDLGATENLTEYINTRAARRSDADILADRVAAGPVEQAAAPTPAYQGLMERLQVAGITTDLENGKLGFGFESPTGKVLHLAQPMPHPWLPERLLAEIGEYTPAMHLEDASARGFQFPWWSYDPRPPLPTEKYNRLAEINARLARMLASHAPEKLTQETITQLENQVYAFFDGLLAPKHLQLSERQLFSGRAVLTPGADLELDQVGLADRISWTLFGPLVIRELRRRGVENAENAVMERTERASKTLDEIMSRSWVIVNRAPTLSPTAMIAFHPVRHPDDIVRIHPLVCEMLNADFDGDQVAVLLPLTERAQDEAGERLTVASHLARDPGLLESLLPPKDALWGLANLGMTKQGRHEIVQIAGMDLADPNGLVTQSSMAASMRVVLGRDGIDAVLSALQQLTRRGFVAAKESGASMSPFIGSSLERPPTPLGDDAETWEAYAEGLTEQILSDTDYANAEMGPQLLAVKIRARGRSALPWLIGLRPAATNADGEIVIVRHNHTEGLTPEEMNACVVGARRGLARVGHRWDEMGQDARERGKPQSFNVLARARRAKRPGIVFARAAATGETDPLADIDSRLFVGLPANKNE